MSSTSFGLPSISDNLENTVNEAEKSGANVFKTIAKVIGIDLEQMSLAKLLYSFVLLIVLILISKIISHIISKALSKTKMNEGLRKFLVRAVRFIMYFVSILIFADSIGIPVTSIIALLSLFGLAISLSLQNLLSNIMSGVSLLMLKPFAIGDYIELDTAGTVKNIGLFYTEIVTFDNKKVFIPNEKIIESTLTNYTTADERRVDISVGVEYDSDVESVKKALAEAVTAVPQLLEEPKPLIGIADFEDSAIKFDVKAWTKTEDYFDAKYALYETVLRAFKEYNIIIPYNKLDINIAK